jgi:hypothetical protein
MAATLRMDTRGMTETAALGMLLGTAFLLAIATGVFMLAGTSP